MTIGLPDESLGLDQLSAQDLTVRWIYAFQYSNQLGNIKVGQTERCVKDRVREIVGTAGMAHVTEILMARPAQRRDGSTFTDKDIHEQLEKLPGVSKVAGNGGDEWFSCTISDVEAAYNAVFANLPIGGVRDKAFELRDEQKAAVAVTSRYFLGRPAGEKARFLWNAKMRFGKTFAAYHLAKSLGAKRVLVITYKPAVQDAWQADLETHVDFDGWIFVARDSEVRLEDVDPELPLVCFASLQDLRSRQDGLIKKHNEAIYATTWDLVIVDEYHYGAWNDATQELLAGEGSSRELKEAQGIDDGAAAETPIDERLPGITSSRFLCLSGTPFRAIASREFGPDQIYNWTYTDEQRAKLNFSIDHPSRWNPYAALPKMTMLVYELPPRLADIARKGIRNEFDLNEFFAASGEGHSATFTHKDQVQGWLDWLRAADLAAFEELEDPMKKPFPYSNTNVLPYLNHAVWFLPNVAAVHAMANLLAEPQNVPYWGQYTVRAVAGDGAGIGKAALPPVREAIGSGFESKSITLTCGKLLTGVTVPQWSAILMLTNIQAPETYFQAAFRVQSQWSVWNPDGDDPNLEQIVKPNCIVVDFAPNRSLRLFAEYGARLGEGLDADADVRELSRFLPVLGFDGTRMRARTVDEIIDAAFLSTSADVLKMGDGRFVNADESRLRLVSEATRVALSQVVAGEISQQPEGEETQINETDGLHDPSSPPGGDEPVDQSDEDDAAGVEIDLLAERLQTLSNRIKVFMYLSNVIEKNLGEVLTTSEQELFEEVMGLDVPSMNDLVAAGLFNEQSLRLLIHFFRRADEAAARGYLD